MLGERERGSARRLRPELPARLRAPQLPAGGQRADARDRAEDGEKLTEIVDDNDLPDAGDVIFVEVMVTDPSDFASTLDVRGQVRHSRYRVLTMESPSVPNALEAMLLHVRDTTGVRPHIHFEWIEGNPALNFLRFLLFGVGEVAP